MRRSYALLIIAIMIGGIVASATYAALYVRTGPPDCGTPPTGGTPSLAYGGFTTINGISFIQQNITFTASEQQVYIGDPNNVGFQTVTFFDPNFPHLVGNQCLSEPNRPYTGSLRVSFLMVRARSSSSSTAESPL